MALLTSLYSQTELVLLYLYMYYCQTKCDKTVWQCTKPDYVKKQLLLLHFKKIFYCWNICCIMFGQLTKHTVDLGGIGQWGVDSGHLMVTQLCSPVYAGQHDLADLTPRSFHMRSLHIKSLLSSCLAVLAASFYLSDVTKTKWP